MTPEEAQSIIRQCEELDAAYLRLEESIESDQRSLRQLHGPLTHWMQVQQEQQQFNLKVDSASGGGGVHTKRKTHQHHLHNTQQLFNSTLHIVTITSDAIATPATQPIVTANALDTEKAPITTLHFLVTNQSQLTIETDPNVVSLVIHIRFLPLMIPSSSSSSSHSIPSLLFLLPFPAASWAPNDSIHGLCPIDSGVFNAAHQIHVEIRMRINKKIREREGEKETNVFTDLLLDDYVLDEFDFSNVQMTPSSESSVIVVNGGAASSHPFLSQSKRRKMDGTESNMTAADAINMQLIHEVNLMPAAIPALFGSIFSAPNWYTQYVPVDWTSSKSISSSHESSLAKLQSPSVYGLHITFLFPLLAPGVSISSLNHRVVLSAFLHRLLGYLMPAHSAPVHILLQQQKIYKMLVMMQQQQQQSPPSGNAEDGEDEYHSIRFTTNMRGHKVEWRVNYKFPQPNTASPVFSLDITTSCRHLLPSIRTCILRRFLSLLGSTVPCSVVPSSTPAISIMPSSRTSGTSSSTSSALSIDERQHQMTATDWFMKWLTLMRPSRAASTTTTTSTTHASRTIQSRRSIWLLQHVQLLCTHLLDIQQQIQQLQQKLVEHQNDPNMSSMIMKDVLELYHRIRNQTSMDNNGLDEKTIGMQTIIC